MEAGEATNKVFWKSSVHSSNNFTESKHMVLPRNSLELKTESEMKKKSQTDEGHDLKKIKERKRCRRARIIQKCSLMS